MKQQPCPFELLTTAEAAKFLRCSLSYLKRLRWAKKGPHYVKRGHIILYEKNELIAFHHQQVKLQTDDDWVDQTGEV